MNELEVLIPGVILKPAAQSDLGEILLYLAQNNPQSAARFANSVLQTFQQLAEMPHLGSPRYYDDAHLRDVRQWPVQNFKNYLIFYRPFASSNGIEVLRVLHSSRDATAHLGDDATREE